MMKIKNLLVQLPIFVSKMSGQIHVTKILTRSQSLTLDNVSSNDIEIQHLRKRLISWNCLVLKGDFIQTCCCAHILNLIVKDDLKEIDDSIFKICVVVKYIILSSSRLSKYIVFV